ncbi:MAG: YtxH domain-containing protein [Saprospiraceae bacterium]|jgi:gas vesicle protein|nr:YtxH domain-containing protein [Saprospiraceae bacterium]MBL0026107.1 YtxH domain-containing protein [Saprospiraceae bacterium]
MMKLGRILFGILTAVGAGAVLGVLFAPDKGSETRNKLSKKTNDFGSDLNAKFNDVVDTVHKKMDYLKNETDKMAQELRMKAEHHKSDATTSEKAKMN